MNREEYLKSKNQPPAIKHEATNPVDNRESILVPIESLKDYLKIRQHVEDFDQHVKIDEFLTAEDFEAFDENFEKVMDSLQFKDKEVTEDEIEGAIKAMKAVDWKWGGKTPTYNEFVDQIKYCYEHSLKQGLARTSCGTGGVTVETDIYDHSVRVIFGHIDAFAYDGESFAIC